MLDSYNRFFGKAMLLLDALVLFGSWILAYWLRFKSGLFETTDIPAISLYLTMVFPILLVYGAVFNSLGLYGSQRINRRTTEVHLLIKGAVVSLFVLISLTYFFSDYKFSRLTIGLFTLTSIASLIFYRLSLRNFLRALRKRGYNLRHVLILGDEELAEKVISRIKRHPESGLNPVGYLSADRASGSIKGVPCVGAYEDVIGILRGELKDKVSLEIDKVLVALSAERISRLDGILSQIYEEPVDIQLIPDVFKYVKIGCRIEDWDGLPLVQLNQSPIEGWSIYSKRVFDIILSAIGLIILSPLMLFLALLIKLTSRGPVFYSQVRMGLDNKEFKMWKFRSMKVGAEKETGAVWAKENDDRKTAIGTLMRATSLDELPQFWNVLMGQMSLVGPRPERPVFVKEFKSKIPSYMFRHKVKAGVTGWAQVNGWRGNTSLEKRIEYDLYYIQNWSILLDVKILFLTIWKGLVNKNAY